MNTEFLARYIFNQGTSLVIMSSHRQNIGSKFNPEKLVNKLTAPLLLIPPGETQLPQRLSYLTDLRYCRTDVLNRILQLTSTLRTTISVAHLSLPGLPDLTSAFALELFNEIGQKCIAGDRLLLHHIPDQPVGTVADVLINALQYDGLVLANHSPHYSQLISEHIFKNESGINHTAFLLFPG